MSDARSWTVLAGAVLSLGMAPPPGEVVHDTRVDESNRVLVEVDNGTGAKVRVASARLAFFDRQGKRLEQALVECEEDCEVAPGVSETIGPVEGPKGWETVEVVEVLYEAEEPPPGTAQAPAAAVQAPAPLTCVEHCRKMNSAPGCASPEDAALCPSSCRDIEQKTACRPQLDAALACSARTTFGCKAGRVDLGACDPLQDAWAKCYVGPTP